MKLSSLLLNIFSNILKNCGNNKTGNLQFVKTYFSPDLNKGTTFATFILSGKQPLVNDKLYICIKKVKQYN